MRLMQKSWLAGASLIVLAGMAVNPAMAGTVVVSPTDLNGWAFSNTDNSGTNASGGFEVGPATPPLGIGSAQLVVGDANSSEILISALSAPTAPGSFSTLNYSTYVTTSTLGSGSAPTLQFDLFAGNTYEGRLVFDPGLLLTVTDGTWQSWNAATEQAWYFTPNSHNSLSSDCSIGNSSKYCTLATAESFLSGLGIEAVDVLFKAGSGQSSFDGNVDDLSIGTSADTRTTFNFEPAVAAPEPASLTLLGSALFGLGVWRRRKGEVTMQR
jgi:PEP-CTERM motif